MKFMKLGSRPDQFQTDGDNIRYVATELATDMVVSVGDVKFYVHKFPLLSKSSFLQKLVTNNTDKPEIDIHDIPGGPAAFEICAKFCYGMVATLNAYNVVPARCAAEYLEMYEAVDKGNLIYKIDVFLSSSIFRSWKDSIIALQTTKSFLPWSEELKIVSHCLDSIAGRASTDPSRVDWSYTYDRNKTETTGLRKQLTVPRDWWVEDLCDLHIDLYKRVILTIRAKEKMAANIIGESLKAYTLKRVPFLAIKGNDVTKYSYVVETIISLLPTEKNCVPCGFLIKLLQAAINFECGETGRAELMRRIAGRLDESSVGDLMIRSSNGDMSICDVEVVHELVERFVMREHGAQTDGCDVFEDEIMCKDFNDFNDSKGKVARLVDGYLAEAARDSSLTLTKFVGLAEMVSGFLRASHDGIYRAVDMYLKEHPSLTKSEKKRICRLMDCKKLSAVACAHAVQNERLPLRVVVQVLFFEQARAAGGSTPDLPGPVRSLLPRGSYGSSATTTTSDEDWDGDRTSEELKGELTSLRMENNKGGVVDSGDKVTAKKVKKMFSRLWSNKERQGETSESDTSASTSGEIRDAAVVRVSARTTTNRTQKKLLETK